jgi:hypothetical protein
MPQQAGVPPDHRKVERAIVFQLLRDDHDERWSRDELATVLGDDPSAIAAALERLREHKVLVEHDDGIGASPCVRRLDALAVIGI